MGFEMHELLLRHAAGGLPATRPAITVASGPAPNPYNAPMAPLLASLLTRLAVAAPAAQDATPPAIAPTRNGLLLLTIVMLLGVVLLVCAGSMVLLSARRRHRRRHRPQKKPDFATPDPWKESAARMSPAEYLDNAEDRPHG